MVTKIQLGKCLIDGGRFCNRLLSYVLGKELAASMNVEVEVVPWIGDILFDLDDKRPVGLIPEYTETDAISLGGRDVVSLMPFFKLAYEFRKPLMRRDVFQKHLNWRPWFAPDWSRREECVLHIRRGDFMFTDHGNWPQLAESCARLAVKECGFDNPTVICEPPMGMCSNEWPFEMLRDFHRMVTAKHLFVYPRSTFSQVAGLLGQCQVWMPRDFNNGRTTVRYEKVQDVIE